MAESALDMTDEEFEDQLAKSKKFRESARAFLVGFLERDPPSLEDDDLLPLLRALAFRSLESGFMGMFG